MISTLADILARRSSPELTGKLYDKTPAAILRALSLSRFRKVVRWAAANSPFYREAFAKRGIDPRHIRQPSDLGDFYTMPEDIVNHSSQFICRPPSIVFESSGTSGKNKLVYYGKDELEEMGLSMAAGMCLMGVLPTDRVANAFDFSIWIPGMVCHYGLMAAGAFTLAFGKVDPIEVYRRLEQHKFTVVLGEPTWLIRLTELAERYGSYPLKLLLGGAEEMPADAIPWMQRVWQGATVKMCYGSVEQGSAIGFQPCAQTEGYHLDDVSFLPEIIETDEDGYGELVFTTLRRRVMPLIRYRTRDVTRMLDRCPCGMRAPKIARLRGRRDELIVASGGNLYPKLFENIISAVPGLTHDWQVVFKLEGVREIMEINVESTRPDEDQIRSEIHEQGANQYPDLMKNLALGIFEMRILVHPPGTMRVSRKLKRVVDRRHFAPAAEIEKEKLVERRVPEGIHS